MIGPEKTRTLFGNDTRYGLFIGWAVGMLLPVCSLGVIPVVRELHRIGVKPGTIIAFGLTAPLFNPLSILYGLSLSNPLAIIIFSGVSMVIVTGLGAVWGILFRHVPAESDSFGKGDEAVPTTGIRRSIAVIHHATAELTGRSGLFMAIGIFVSVAIAVMFPHGSLQGETEPDKVFAPAFMACYMTPVYSTPLQAMGQIGSMFQHGNSVGAAFSLLVLGAGVNAGLLTWFGGALGIRKVIVFLLLLLSFTIGLAYALDKPLYPKGVDPSGHTHAFDVYSHPFQKDTTGLYKQAVNEIKENYKFELTAAYLLALLALVGAAFRIADSGHRLSNWYQETKKVVSAKWDIALPGWVIGIAACVGLIFVSVVGTYVYYPDSKSAIEDLRGINNNCVVAARTGDWDGVEKWVLFCNDLSRRLEVGVFLREGKVSEFRRAKAKVYREKLEKLRDDIEDGQTENADELASDVQSAYLQLSKAFRKE